MNESEWLASTDPATMLYQLQDGSRYRRPPDGPAQRFYPASDRKLRLFAVACCRQVWHLMTDDAPCPECGGQKGQWEIYTEKYAPLYGKRRLIPCDFCHGTGRINRSRRAVEVSERFADGVATEQERAEAEFSAANAVPRLPDGRVSDASHPSLMSCYAAWLQRHPNYGPQRIVSTWPSPTQADLLREIIGNPFRPVTLPVEEWEPSPLGPIERAKPHCPWLTPTVLALARAAYDERVKTKCPECKGVGIIGTGYGQFGWRECKNCNRTGELDDGTLDPARLKILADAVEEAGCDNRDMLDHLRSEGPHVRGCWVLDLFLGRQ